MEKLTKREIEILFEALSSWVNRGLAGNVMGMVLTTMVTKNRPEDQEFAKKLIQDQKVEFEREKAKSKEIAILIQAKLIKIKDQIEVENLIS